MKDNIGLFLSKRAYLSPRLEGYVDAATGARLTWAELESRSNRTAQALLAIGVEREQRVAILAMNGVEFIETFFAVAKIGAIAVPLNWRLAPSELAFIIGDSEARVLVYDADFREAVLALRSDDNVQATVRSWIEIAGEGRPLEFARSYHDLQRDASDALPEVDASDADPLYIMYTSGTTGLPKGAVHTHESAIWACITSRATADLRYRDRYLLALPLFHVGALSPMATNVYAGATNVVMRTFDPTRAWETIERERIDAMLAVPAMLNLMYQVPERDRYDRSRLRWIMSGAAPVPVTLIQAYIDLGIEIHQVYGLTESCGPACLLLSDDAVRKAGSTGKPFFHTDVRIVDEQGADVAPGATGEVLVRGRHIMKEYWRRPEATAETIRDGWLYTGDLACTDDEGFVYIQDRKKDMIISGGENVYPAEIENVLLSHPGIADAAVIGQPSEKWGESPAAIVVKKDPALTADSVREWCRTRLARYKVPRVVEFVEEIPRNPSGKILKRVLRERFPGPAPE